jgi:hypothetical protein
LHERVEVVVAQLHPGEVFVVADLCHAVVIARV